MINRRQKVFLYTGFSLILIMGILLVDVFVSGENLRTDFSQQGLSPSFAHWFGTDWLGRDMLLRTVKGLALSVKVGVVASLASTLIALVLGVSAAVFGQRTDAFISWLTDLFLGIPHLILLILISFALGGGVRGVVIGVALTHWPSLTRIIRAEVLQLKSMPYVQASIRFGKGSFYVARKHMLPHLMPQLMVGLILLFPHAVLHEASITFLGFGLDPARPAIGIILSESMRYLTGGYWWLAVFPGLALLIVIRLVDVVGDNLHMLSDPQQGQL